METTRTVLTSVNNDVFMLSPATSPTSPASFKVGFTCNQHCLFILYKTLTPHSLFLLIKFSEFYKFIS